MPHLMRRSVVRCGPAGPVDVETRALEGAAGSAMARPVSDRLADAVVWLVEGCATMRTCAATAVAAVGINVISCESAAEFLDRYDPDQPCCLVAASDLPGACGFELLARLGGAGSPIPIVLTTRRRRYDIAVDAFRAGAADVLMDPFGADVVRDRLVPLLERDRMRHEARAGRARVLARLASLTARERAVLDGLLDGHTSKEIAQVLAISARTVEAHRAHLLDKLDAGSTGKVLRMVLLATQPTDLRTT
jgi:two-component system, LuxR family, response regulator FixJ